MRLKGGLLMAGTGVLIALTVVVALYASRLPASPARAGAGFAEALLHDTSGAAVGRVTFIQDGPRVRVEAEVAGLPPGFHGFHVHSTGTCVPGSDVPFSSAGGHFDLASRDHARHAGDLPVLYVQGDGRGVLAFAIDTFAVDDLFDPDGSAVIVHAGPDNYANIPPRYTPAPDMATLATGDAGGRIACGAVGRAGLTGGGRTER